MRLPYFFALVAVLVSGLVTRGQGLRLLPFQARLTDAAGKPFPDGGIAIQFQIFAEPVGGAPLWPGEIHRATINEGLVNIVLGSKNPLPLSRPADDSRPFFSSTLYLQVTPDTNGDGKVIDELPLHPRQAIIPSLYSMEAGRALTAAAADKAATLSGFDWQVVFGANTPAFGHIPRAALSAEATVPIGALLPMGNEIGPVGFSPTEFELAAPDRIITRTKLPTPRGIQLTAVIGQRIFAIGSPLSDRKGLTEVYDLDRDEWRTLNDWPRPRDFASAISVGGMIYVVGGAPVAPGNFSPASIAWVDIYESATGNWVQGPDLPVATHSAVVAVVGDTLFVMGGFQGYNINTYIMEPLTTVQTFDTKTKTWHSDRKPLPADIQGFAAVSLGDTIHIVGGSTPKQALPVYQSDHYAYDPIADVWSNRTASPVAGVSTRALTMAGKMLTFGPGILLRYDPATDLWSTTASPLAPVNAEAIWGVGDRLLFREGRSFYANDNIREFLPGQQVRFWRQN